MSGLSALLCWTHLLSLYSVLGSLLCVVVSYQCNVAAVQHFFVTGAQHPPLLHTILSLNVTGILHNSTPVMALGSNYFIQAFLYLAFVCMQVDLDNMSFIKNLIIWTFLLPSCSMLVTFSKDITLSATMMCALVPLIITKWRIIKGIPYAVNVILSGCRFAKSIVGNIGVHALFESEWSRLNIPNVFRIFWIIRIANYISIFVANELNNLESHNIIDLLDASILYNIFKSSMTQGCDTVLALLGMTSMVAYVSHYIGVLFQALLLTDEDRSMGTVSGILFFVLAEQSGLTILEGEKRYIRLCRNFCLLFTAMLYFVHNMVNPVLMSLSASRHMSLYRHVRALSVCIVLIVVPIGLLVSLWSVFSLTTWLLAVSAFSVQVVLKTLVTILIYILFLADAHYCIVWDNLDDYVYYIRAVGNTIEFLFGIILFFNGLWIYFFESGGVTRALMMCVHAYVNIWCEARNGWAAFIKRRTAVYRISSIPNATAKQLSEHDDVCSICFQALTSAKITKCNHFYHELCLRKWLYLQDTCPLCHVTIDINDTAKDEVLIEAGIQNTEAVASQTDDEDQEYFELDSESEELDSCDDKVNSSEEIPSADETFSSNFVTRVLRSSPTSNGSSAEDSNLPINRNLDEVQ